MLRSIGVVMLAGACFARPAMQPFPRECAWGKGVVEAAGLPVVASDVGGLGRLCAAHPGSAAVFPPLDAAALDAAIEKARREGEAMSAAGRIAAAKYDWEALSQILVDFYAKI